MSNINNTKNVVGMCDLLADADENLDIEDLERSIISGVTPQKKSATLDLAKEYSKEIDDLGRKFGVSSFKQPAKDPNDIDDLLNWNPSNSGTPAVENKREPQINSYKPPLNLVDDDEDEEDEEVPTTYYPSNNARSSSNEWAPSNPRDEQLSRMTNEERKQDHVNKVLNGMDKTNDDAEFVRQEDEEDEMADIMERIDTLRTSLTTEGKDLSNIPEVNSGTSKKEAKAVLRILTIKNDRARYCDFFEEGILAVAYGLEGIFNGKSEIFGSRIDLTGYSDTVKVKLRRMRYDTSHFVSSVMQGYNINSGWRIALELVPSLFLYSRDRKMTANDNLLSDENYKKAVQDLA
jgi:hypothetical protein